MTRNWYINVDSYPVDYGPDEDDLDIQVEKLCKAFKRTGKSAVIEYGYEECSDYQRIVIEGGVVVKRESCL